MYTFKILQRNSLSLDQCLRLTTIDKKCYADDVTLPAQGTGTTTPTVATDEVSSRHFQKIKLVYGADGTATDTTTSAGFPVQIVAGSASIGVLGANSGVDIGDVTINNASGGSAVNIQDGGNIITVDGTIAATQSGSWVLSANSGTDIGDVTINNASGGSAVNIQDGGNAITVDNGGTFVVQDSQVGTDNEGFTDGTTKIFNAGFIFDEVAGTTLTENDNAAARIDSKRAQVLVIEDATTRGRRAQVTSQGRQVFEKSADGVTISGNILLQQLRQPVNVNANGQILVSGVANRKIRVLNGGIMAPTAVTVGLKSNNNTDLSGPLPFGANGGFQIPHADLGNFETRIGESLTIALSSAVQVGGWITYVLV